MSEGPLLTTPWEAQATGEQRLAAAAAAWQDAIIYHVVLDRFQSSTVPLAERRARSPYVFHGGDLRGLRDELEYIADLGATTVWLGPLYRQRDGVIYREDMARPMPCSSQDTENVREAYHGYHPWDFAEIDPHFGTLDDLREVVARAHDIGIRIMLDMIVNHAGYHFPGLPDAGLSAYDDPSNTIFHRRGELRSHPSPASDWDDPDKREHFDVLGLPDFNQDNPLVADYLVGAARWWIDKARGGVRADGSLDAIGLDAIRMDTVKHVGRAFWREVWHPRVTLDTALNRSRPGGLVFTVGEVMHGSADFVAAYQREGFPSALDFPLHYALMDAFARGGPMSHVAAAFERDGAYRDPHLLVTFLDNLDVTRFSEEALRSTGGDAREAARRLAGGLTFLMACRGIPCLYYGTELGLRGADNVLGRSDMHAFSAIERTETEERLFRHVQALCRLRRSTPALTHGRQRVSAADDDAIVIARELGNETVLVVARRPQGGGAPRLIQAPYASRSAAAQPDGFELTELIAPDPGAPSPSLQGGVLRVEVRPGGVRVLRIAPRATAAPLAWKPPVPTTPTEAPPRPHAYPIIVGDRHAWVHDEGSAAGYFHTYDALQAGPARQSRKVHVFLPRDYARTSERLPVLLMNDGHVAFWPGGLAGQSWAVADVLSAEYAAARVRPMIVVAIVPALVRDEDYSLASPTGGADAYARWVDSALAFVERHYRVSPDATDRAIIGASRGGVAAFRVATRLPDRIGKVAAMSPSFWHGLDQARSLRASPIVMDVADVLASPARRPKVWLDWGTAHTGHPEAVRLEERTRARGKELAALLEDDFGYLPRENLVAFEEEAGEHNELSWRRRLPRVLRWFFPLSR